MQKSKGREFIDASMELASVMLQRDMGLATKEEVDEAREKVLRSRAAAQEETVNEMLATCDAVASKQRRQHENENNHRGPKIGTSLGDLLRAAGKVSP